MGEPAHDAEVGDGEDGNLGIGNGFENGHDRRYVNRLLQCPAHHRRFYTQSARSAIPLEQARSEHAATHLVELDAFEQRLEVALSKAFIALALDDLEEDRTDHVLSEDLE